MKPIYEVAIIGGGIAGLSCAQKLFEAGVDFVLITKDIGGRIKSSKDGLVNYGAVWIGSNYRHASRYVERGRRVKKTSAYNYAAGTGRSFVWIVLQHPLQFLKTIFLALRFRSAYFEFQKRTEKVSQKQAIEENDYLRGLYFQSAEEFVRQHSIEDIAREVLEPAMYCILISRLAEQTAFNFLLMGLSLVLRGYEFSFQPERHFGSFQNKIVIDEVVAITRTDTENLLITASGTKIQATHVVVATASPVAQKLLSLPAIKQGRNVYVLHVEGMLRRKYRKGYMKFFGYESDLFFMLRAARGTYTAYALKEDVNLEPFFEQSNVIAKTGWYPIYNVIGKTLLDARQGERVWLIGDHNIVGLEDSSISGSFVAGKIICDLADIQADAKES